MKRILMIGGPNGAGKTTAAMTLLPKFLPIHEFLNADEIARGLNPIHPEAQTMASGRIMLERMQRLQRDGKSFAFESTCASRRHIHFLSACKAQGYEIILLFLWLPSPDMAAQRVAHRVREGGHSIPLPTIHRRYHRGLWHLVHDYMPLADQVTLYDNTHGSLSPIFERVNGQNPTLHQPELWQHIRSSTDEKD